MGNYVTHERCPHIRVSHCTQYVIPMTTLQFDNFIGTEDWPSSQFSNYGWGNTFQVWNVMNAVGNIQKKKIMTKQTYIQNKKGTSLENCMKLKYIAHICTCS